MSKNKVAVKVIDKSKLDKIELVRTVVTTTVFSSPPPAARPIAHACSRNPVESLVELVLITADDCPYTRTHLGCARRLGGFDAVAFWLVLPCGPPPSYDRRSTSSTK